MSKAKLTICTGYDRSGTSLISKLLSKHPEINLLFQPFNSTEIVETNWDICATSHVAPDTELFVARLLNGYIDTGYIKSHWFYKHSTSYEVDLDRINLIKDTNCHFKLEWLKSKFPDIGFWGTWRDPLAIMCSLVRNDFHKTWYGSLTEEVLVD